MNEKMLALMETLAQMQANSAAMLETLAKLQASNPANVSTARADAASSPSKCTTNNTYAKIQYNRAIRSISMKRNDHPSVLFEQIAAVQAKYSHFTTSDEDLWAEIVGALPDEYQCIVASAERFAQENKSQVSLTAVEIELDAHYQRLYGAMKYKRGTEPQTGQGELTFGALAPGMGRKKSVTCYACGKEGHIKKECPQNRSEGTTKTPCPLCKKKHKGGEEACFQNPKNAGKAKKWRRKENRSKAEVGGREDAPQFGFQVTTKLMSVPTLADPHLYLASSGASVDMVSSLAGAEDIVPGNTRILCANGMYEIAARCGTLRKVYRSKDGKELNIVLSDVHEVPSLPFNVISLTKRLEAGGTMFGDDTGISVTSANGTTLKFDIEIPTEKGAVWAAYLYPRPANQLAMSTIPIPPTTATREHEETPSDEVGRGDGIPR
jgi:hypothetical protein